MAARLPLLALALWFWLVGVASLRAVEVGASKSDVIAELGRPTSQVSRENREILSYPKGVRIELIDGKVESAEGMALTFPAEEAPSKSAPAATPKPEPVHPKASPVEQHSAPATTPTPSAKPPSTAGKPTDPVAALDRLMQQAEEERNHTHSKRAIDELPLLQLALLLVFHFVVTLIALKLAFKFWTMDSLWSGVLMIALIDLILHGIFDALGPVTNGLSTMPAVENGIPGIVMIFSIRHFCFNKNLGDAIQTASVVKVAVALLKIFGAMALLNSAFH